MTTRQNKEVKIHKAKIGKLKSNKAMFQKQIGEHRKLITKNQYENEELPHYGRRLCLPIYVVPIEKGETSEGILKKVISMCEEAELDIPGAFIDLAHCIGN